MALLSHNGAIGHQGGETMTATTTVPATAWRLDAELCVCKKVTARDYNERLRPLKIVWSLADQPATGEM
jgi:hypothetical protein